MVVLVLFLVLRFNMSRVIRVGTIGSDTIGEARSMTAQATGGVNYMTLESIVGTDYQVPSGKTFYITKLILAPTSTASKCRLGYGDTGVANGAAAPTNAVDLTNSSQFSCTDNTTVVYDNLFFAIPSLKYPYVKSDQQSATVTIFGIEV